MPFGDREDELWEAMKPSFKPRLVSDPNLKYAWHLVNGTGPFATRTPATSHVRGDARATLARVVRRTPDGRTADVTPQPFNVRTRVHEYGGGAFAVSDGVVYFSNFADQRLYRQDGSHRCCP